MLLVVRIRSNISPLRKKAAAYVPLSAILRRILRMTEILTEKGRLLVISNSLFSPER
jgi:hypothetical protein